MSREVMHRKASDNEYLHKDFHGALNFALAYVHEGWGIRGVREYLERFARTYHAPRIEAIRRDGLDALEAYLRDLYDREGGEVEFERESDRLTLRVRRCPALGHLQHRGDEPVPFFCETTRIVNRVLCEGGGVAFELAEVDPGRAACVQVFRRVEA